jgi:hypothetical protein
VREETGLMEILDAEKNEILDGKRKIEKRYELTLSRLECISANLLIARLISDCQIFHWTGLSSVVAN